MNLATARSMRRAREVGLRKVIGAHRGQLIRQFMGESMLTAGIALAGALVLGYRTNPIDVIDYFTARIDGGDVLASAASARSRAAPRPRRSCGAKRPGITRCYVGAQARR